MNRKEFVFILSVTFIAIMIWIIANLLHDRSSVSVSPDLQQTLEDVNPNFDQSIIDNIKTHR